MIFVINAIRHIISPASIVFRSIMALTSFAVSYAGCILPRMYFVHLAQYWETDL